MADTPAIADRNLEATTNISLKREPACFAFLSACSLSAPMRAVVIDVEEIAASRTFRDELRRITRAAVPPLPHISLLYAVEETGRQPKWMSDESRLKGIAEECEQRVEVSEFILDRPVIVVPDGDWGNIRSWRVMRTL